MFLDRYEHGVRLTAQPKARGGEGKLQRHAVVGPTWFSGHFRLDLGASGWLEAHFRSLRDDVLGDLQERGP